MVTFDILKHYCELEGDPERLISSIEEPQNALLLQNDAHDWFEDLQWCLFPTEVRRHTMLRGMVMFNLTPSVAGS